MKYKFAVQMRPALLVGRIGRHDLLKLTGRSGRHGILPWVPGSGAVQGFPALWRKTGRRGEYVDPAIMISAKRAAALAVLLCPGKEG